MSGSIVVPVKDDQARFNRFFLSLAALEKPAGTRVSTLTGGSVPETLNAFIQEHMHGDFLLRIDDDHLFPPNMLTQLLSHDVDVVAPLTFTRKTPFFWTIFREKIEPVSNGIQYTPDGVRELKGMPGWVTYDTDEVPPSGLFEVFATGGNILVKRHVLDAIGFPWFENVTTHHLAEDLVFCDKIRAAGFKIHVDLDMPIGHLGTMSTHPHYDEEKGWGLRMTFPGGPGEMFMAGTDQRKEGAKRVKEEVAGAV